MLLLALGGCAAAGGERAASDARPLLVASRVGLGASSTASATRPPAAALPKPTLQERAGLVVTTTACWYPAGLRATAGDALPKLDPKLCRTVSERVVVDGPADADTLHRVEALTVQDVGLKLEALTALPDEE